MHHMRFNDENATVISGSLKVSSRYKASSLIHEQVGAKGIASLP